MGIQGRTSSDNNQTNELAQFFLSSRQVLPVLTALASGGKALESTAVKAER